jgi:predicted nucleotidyltransferase component of viral defense system
MRTLGKDRLDLIDALVAESDLVGITAGLLEKDEHLTDALRAVFALEFEHVRLVFCGGTSLSKAHSLIERMSEDADIKVVLTETGLKLSRTKLQGYLGDEVRARVSNALVELGFVEDADKAHSLNERRYQHSQWSYERGYDSAAGLRPNLQLELTVRGPTLPTTNCSLQSLANRLAKRDGGNFNVETISVAETQAEKVLSFLRRFSQHRSGQMLRAWDTALVRHIYDVHCINLQSSELVADSAKAFSTLVRGDTEEFGRQQPDFLEDPFGVLSRALDQVKTDSQTRDEYEQNLLPLVYGNFKPHFDEAFTVFERVARALLAEAGK